ncbi:MAG TPA: class I tRNA ligase family protein, partial [Candidatus Paceibacterota bacterium]
NWGDTLGGKLLVGGGRTENEDPVKCALREIAEETGYTDIEFIERLPQTITHNYFAASKNVWRTIDVVALKLRLKSEARNEPSLEEDEKNKFTVLWQTKEELSNDITDKAHGYVFRKFAGLPPRVVRDQDTFDTWFSSGQWPFATLGFPDGEDFRRFYPTQVMETAGEIIFFWVARMLMLGLYRTGTLPFNTVYLHGIVTARDGKKMSKSRGNVISPLELTKKYGTDALRMALIIGNTPGTSTALYEEKIKAYKLFANKLWNIARFVLSTIDGVELDRSTQLNGKDRATLLELSGIAKEITENIEQYRFYIAGEKIYHYVWNTFADKILEESKLRLAGDDAADKRSAQLMLFLLLEQSLILLHPFMPFITEEIWGSLPDRKWPLIVTPYVS